MSVINKMLTDLDQRRASAIASPENKTLTTGTASLGGMSRYRGTSASSSRVRVFWAVAAGAACVLGGAGVWWSRVAAVHPAPTVVAVAIPPAPAPAAVVVPAVVAPVALPELSASASVPAPAPIASASVIGIPAKPLPDALPPLPKELPPPAVVMSPVPATTAVAPPAVAPASATLKPPVPGNARQAAVQEALVHAQGLWNAGSQEAATELLRSMIATIERTPVGGASGMAASLSPLARELARLELAQGQVGQALDMLVRLEPVLVGDADVWALRGNAAQRLGRHADSAEAYVMALRLKPNEPRWMLGVAVSLAVQGKTADAALWAEKARYSSAMTPELMTYLRQLGVQLQEK